MGKVRDNRLYNEATLKKALEEVEKGMPYRTAARKYYIPRATIARKFKTKSPLTIRPGPPTVFTAEQENVLVEWIREMGKAGFPVSKETLMYSVQKFAEECHVTFHQGTTPGRKWYEGFRRRHPEIVERISQSLTVQKRSATQNDLDKWFEEVGNYLREKGLTEAMKDPRRVFSAGEAAFFLYPRSGKVLVRKGSKAVYATTVGSDEKDNVTVLLTANASGELVTPLVVYQYPHVPQSIVGAVPEDWAIGKSENGWMTQESFYEYITNVFEPWLAKEDIQRPVVIFLDSHMSHASIPLSQFCVSKGIEVVALYPNSTHLLPPLDAAVFHSLKAAWPRKIAEWRKENDGKPVGEREFPTVLKQVLVSLERETISHGFSTCGLVPWGHGREVQGEPSKIIGADRGTGFGLTQSLSQGDADACCLKDVKVKASTIAANPQHQRTMPTCDLAKFLDILEIRIGMEKLESFRSNAGKWEGPESDKSLYYLWLKAKNDVNPQDLQVNVSSLKRTLT